MALTGKTVNIIGAGSLGSFTALLLAKMARAFSWELRLFDFDSVEAHNLRNQLFREADVGVSKVAALADILRLLCGETLALSATEAKIDNETFLRDAIIVLVDNMKTRREAFEAAKYRADVSLFVDARSGGSAAMVYALNPRDPDQVRRYEETLYNDEEAVPAPCADERTAPTIFAIAAAIARILALYENDALAGFIETLINFEQLPNLKSSEHKED